MDTLKSDKGEDYYGLFHESFSPLPMHVDSGFDEGAIIYKQIITPLIGRQVILSFLKKDGMEDQQHSLLIKMN